MHAAAAKAYPPASAKNGYADRLREELDGLVNEQFVSPEFKFLYETPLTIERARFHTVQMRFYTMNRRDCWAYVQARAPVDVKQAIWHHEEDELISDSRTGVDHITMVGREALALGVTEKELAEAKPSPVIHASLLAFTQLALTLPWLGALLSSHFLERRNNNDLIKSPEGGSSVRWRKRLVNELGIDQEKLISVNVHAVADVEHSDLIWNAIAKHVVDD